MQPYGSARGGPSGNNGSTALAQRAGRLLAELVSTPDHTLARYRSQRLGNDCRLEIARLREARDLLQAIVQGLLDPQPQRWHGLRAAWQQLRAQQQRGQGLPPGARGPAPNAAPPPKPPPVSFGVPPRPPLVTPPVVTPHPRTAPATVPRRVPSRPPMVQPPAPPVSPWVRYAKRKAEPTGALPAASSQPTASPGIQPPGVNPAANFQRAARQIRRAAPAARVQPVAGGVQRSPAIARPGAPRRARPAGGLVAPQPPPNVPNLSIEQYAGLCAECRVYPKARERTYARYGVAGPSIHERINEFWRQRFAQDVDLFRRWKQQYDQYCGYLTKR